MEVIKKLPETLISIIEYYTIFKPTSRSKLIEAIEKYGIIGTWNTSLIADMSELFNER